MNDFEGLSTKPFKARMPAQQRANLVTTRNQPVRNMRTDKTRCASEENFQCKICRAGSADLRGKQLRHSHFRRAILVENVFYSSGDSNSRTAFDLPAFEHPDKLAIAQQSKCRRAWRKSCEIATYPIDRLDIVAGESGNHTVGKN